MNKSTFFTIIFFGLIFVCCKKKNDTPEPATNSTSTTGNPSPGGDYGAFVSNYNTNDYGNNVLYSDSSINASFYDSNASGKNSISAGTVSVNNTTLYISPSPLTYYKTNGINMKNLSWQISGDGTIPATSFSYVPSYASYTSGNLLPDTVTKSSGFSFVVDGVSNVNTPVYVFISQGGPTITKTLSTTPATITVSSSEISGFLTPYNFNIRLSLFNYSNVILNSKKYAINANRSYNKSCYLK